MKFFKKTAVAFAVAVALIFAGCASNGTSAVQRDPEVEYQLVVLHTNDHHGSTLSRDGKGGLAERATFVSQVRQEAENVLLLDAGDLNTGMALSNMFNAEPDIKAYNAMGYVAAAFGNHEFDGTLAKLENQIAISDFEWLSANVKKGKAYLGKPYIVKNYEGFRVGIFGLTTQRTKVTASPDKSITFLDEIEVAKEMVNTLRNKEKCDIVILLGHCGDVQETEDQETSLKIAQEVSGIDLIVDGHSHSFFAEPKFVGSTAVVTSNEWGKYVGKGILTIKDGKITEFDWEPVEITTAAFPPDSAVEALLAPYVEQANASLNDVVLHTTAEFEFGNKLTRYQEMALGDFIADSMASYLKQNGIEVDFALTNGGGIRAKLPAGDVTREDILTVLPFENYVYVVSLRGEDLIKLFEFVGSINQGAGGFAQVSKEVRYTITYDENGHGSISGVTISGSEIDPQKTYKLATNDFMAKGGDGYEVLLNAVDKFNTSMLISNVVIDYAASLEDAITPSTDGRITVIGGTLPQ